MNKQNVKLTLLCLFALCSIACTKEDTYPIENPIIGEWESGESQFYTITVNGHIKSLKEFGMEVLKLNESSAEHAAREYLQYNFMGPIAIEEPKLRILPMQILSANLFGEQIEGSWEVVNDGDLLKFSVNSLPIQDYSFNIKRVTSRELELAWNWEMGILEENAEFYEMLLTINLIK